MVSGSEEKSMSEQEPVFEFPCKFPIKVVGKAAPTFEDTVMDIVRRHVPELTSESVRSTGSKKGKFVSLTITIIATGREQLDDIYRDLSSCENVLMAL
jgi:putative lipoic acid-binding regulatory protein